jgi:large subunit ribosomal protein L13
MAVIDVSGAVVGRAATQIAKRLLSGEEIIIVNAEDSIITGRKEQIVERYRTKRNLGGMRKKGPYYPRMPDRMFRRIVRGMLPYKKTTGKDAFKRLMVYIGVPKDLAPKSKEFERMLPGKRYSEYIKLGEISRLLGANVRCGK